MNSKELQNPIYGIRWQRQITVLAIVFILSVVAPAAQAQTYQVIHRFSNGDDGANPAAGLSIDNAGRLYGTTTEGGTHDYGTVFRLVHSGSSWVLSPLYNFAGGSDGEYPESRVIFGPDGSLYSVAGGGSTGCGGYGCGIVFSLRPPSTACKTALCPWTKTTLHAFEGSDGDGPVGDLLFDAGGGIYGATYAGGIKYNDEGVVYHLTPSNGGWSETVLYNLPLYSLHNPEAGVTLDEAGNLYGTAESQPDGYGGVFELTPSGGVWVENEIYAFQGGSDGGLPYAGVILDDAGNLYGATPLFGANNGGTVFELTPSNGSWVFSVLYGFTGSGSGLSGPLANLVFDAAGDLYGTTYSDGAYGLGAVFKLTPGPSGWTYTSLHDFTGPEGANPLSNVIFDGNGNLYGTTAGGGRHDVCNTGCGVVWEITP